MGEVRLDDDKIRIFGTQCTNVTGSDARERHVEGLVLLKSVVTGNLILNRPSSAGCRIYCLEQALPRQLRPIRRWSRECGASMAG
jgi:hypothetical protein